LWQAFGLRREQGLEGSAAGGIVVGVGLLPFGEDLGGDFAAADEFLEVADDGAAGDAELAGEGGDVGAVFGVGDEAADFGLAAEAVGGAAEEEFGVDALGAFEGFKAAEDFGFAAFFEGGGDGFAEEFEVDGLVDDVVGAAGALEGAHLLVDFERAGNNDDGDMGEEFLEAGEEFEAEIALGKDVVEDDGAGGVLGGAFEGVRTGEDAGQFIFRERVLVEFELEIVVFDDENPQLVHDWAREG